MAKYSLDSITYSPGRGGSNPPGDTSGPDCPRTSGHLRPRSSPESAARYTKQVHTGTQRAARTRLQLAKRGGTWRYRKRVPLDLVAVLSRSVGKVFHSFRNTVIDRLKAADVEELLSPKLSDTTTRTSRQAATPRSWMLRGSRRGWLWRVHPLVWVLSGTDLDEILFQRSIK